ncbi:MAG: hypothetical protein OEU92_12485 [Alphaproteobacteria bacterium]|nr:hypothetical protein [Alphaproteobacteria bacterium]
MQAKTYIFFLALSLGGSAAAQPAEAQDHSGHDAPYEGYQTREIKSLSEQDIADIRRGAGWGLALLAELNGKPGPAHLLELKDDIGLSGEQVAAIEIVYKDMRAEAIEAGERFIEAEAALNTAFEGGDLDEARLLDLIAEAASARAALRFTHLSRHLSTPALLTEEQIRRYNVLRGYADDPCGKAPEGHDPDMWRKHNKCG